MDSTKTLSRIARRTQRHALKAWAIASGAGLVLGLLFLGLSALANVQGPPDKKDPQTEHITAVTRGKKLVLKDGSFHIVRSYEQKGDRVRYYSVERSAWEEIPAELVDWEATRKAETETKEKEHQFVEGMKAAETEARAREVDVDASIEVAPGVFLPDNEGLYVVEGRAILPLTQVGTDVKLDKGRLLTQVLIPIAPTKHKIQIAGKKAVLRITTPQPEFYMRTADAREPEMELIRATIKGNVREIQVIHTDLVGQQATTQKSISIERWQVARGVYRLTISQPLELGEYAFAEHLPDGAMNVYVWDFGLDPPTGKDSKK